MTMNEPSAPECGARTRTGGICRSIALLNGRCRVHGGASTGPRTSEGLSHSRRANRKHGLYAGTAILLSKEVRALLRSAHEVSDCLSKVKP